MTSTEIEEGRALTALPEGVRQKFAAAEARRALKLRWSRWLLALVIGATLIYGVRIVVWAWRVAGF